MRRRLAVVSSVVIAVVSLAACGSGSDSSQPSTAGTVATGNTSGTGAAPAPEALSFTAPTVGGGTLDLRTLAGKPTVLWFWAPT